MPEDPSSDKCETSDGGLRAESWVDRYGDALFRYAFAKVHDTSAAEDLVQETFLAAIGGKKTFRNEATVSTWLFAILKRKVADHYRRKVRSKEATELTDDDIRDLLVESTRCRNWGNDPSKTAENHEFRTILQGCIDKLPNKLAEVYILREINEDSPKEIRELLGISATNLSMRLHRCRTAMRDCLSTNWFQDETG